MMHLPDILMLLCHDVILHYDIYTLHYDVIIFDAITLLHYLMML